MERRYQAWLSYENNSGSNIYVAANPLRSGSRKRTKESIASVRHLYLQKLPQLSPHLTSKTRIAGA